jgi:type IX secretion system PorP/SprF family membrane protein
MMKKLYSIIFTLVCLSSIGQQDRPFSMFYASKSQLNPAASGFIEGDFQVFMNYRNQWSAISSKSFNTLSASFDTRLYEDLSFIAGGINIFSDRTGDGEYTVNRVTLPVNYAINLSKTSYLSLGLSPAFFQRSLSPSSLTWDAQWEGVSFNTGTSSGENLPSNQLEVTKIDIGFGAYYQSELSTYSWYSGGVSINHLARPKIGFYNQNLRLPMSVSFHAHGNFRSRQSSLTIKPNVLVMSQGANLLIIGGSSFNFLLREESKHTGYFQKTSIEAGLYYRWLDAIMFNFAYRTSGLGVGLNVDVTASGLSKANKAFGGMEIFINYQFKISTSKGPRVHS